MKSEVLVGQLILSAATWSLQNPKILTIEKSSPVTIFSKTFTFFSWRFGSARARARVTNNTSTKSIVPTCIVCMHVVEAWVTQISHL